ncbi:MAG: Na+/H+ antiporter subunit E [Spirochaetota bacterium]
MGRRYTWSLREFLVPFVLLSAFWCMLTPAITPSSVLIGAVVSACTVIFFRDILFARDELPAYRVRTWPLYIRMLLRLLYEVIRANIDVAATVLNPRLPIHPQFVWVPVDGESEFNRVVHSTCITLTPGTISVEVQEDFILVHALTDKAAAGVVDMFARATLLRVEEVNTQ